jgi:hypothetical protein
LRQPGDVPSGPSLDVATAPEVHVSLATQRLGLALAYTPRLTLWDVNEVGVRPTGFNAGSARADWRGERASLFLSQEAGYGAVNFAGLALAPGPDGAPPRVDVVPAPQSLAYESSSTSFGSRAQVRRWELRSQVGYQVSGGADAPARQIIPLQNGPTFEAAAAFAESPVDHLATTATGSETSFSSGPRIVLAEIDEGWKHTWSPRTETTLTFGVSDARARGSAYAGSYTEVDPVAEGLVDAGLGTARDRVTLHIGARLGPVVNRLLGIVDERGQGTLLAKWTRGPFGADAFVSAQQSVHATGPDATELVTGQCGLSYAATDVVAFDVGVRGIWQRANQPLVSSAGGASVISETDLAQGLVFLGVTFTSPCMQL